MKNTARNDLVLFVVRCLMFGVVLVCPKYLCCDIHINQIICVEVVGIVPAATVIRCSLCYKKKLNRAKNHDPVMDDSANPRQIQMKYMVSAKF